jgi:hypothetical protein
MTSIQLTPNYERMFRQMLRETRNQGDARTMFTPSADDRRAELLRDVQRWFAPLTIAANSATTVDAINELRAAMSDMLSAIDQEAARLERGVEDDPTDGEGLL